MAVATVGTATTVSDMAAEAGAGATVVVVNIAAEVHDFIIERGSRCSSFFEIMAVDSVTRRQGGGSKNTTQAMTRRCQDVQTRLLHRGQLPPEVAHNARLLYPRP